jgi:hypothetical protein
VGEYDVAGLLFESLTQHLLGEAFMHLERKLRDKEAPR